MVYSDDKESRSRGSRPETPQPRSESPRRPTQSSITDTSSSHTKIQPQGLLEIPGLTSPPERGESSTQGGGQEWQSQLQQTLIQSVSPEPENENSSPDAFDYERDGSQFEQSGNNQASNIFDQAFAGLDFQEAMDDPDIDLLSGSPTTQPPQASPQMQFVDPRLLERPGSVNPLAVSPGSLDTRKRKPTSPPGSEQLPQRPRTGLTPEQSKSPQRSKPPSPIPGASGNTRNLLQIPGLTAPSPERGEPSAEAARRGQAMQGWQQEQDDAITPAPLGESSYSRQSQPPRQQSSLVTPDTETQVTQKIEGIRSDSDPELLDIYKDLLKSQTFREEVHNIVTSEQEIGLYINPNIRSGAKYNFASASVFVKPHIYGGRIKSKQQMRGEILFELHNAKKAEALKKMLSDYELQAGNYFSHNLSGRQDDCRKAAKALIIEWIEWRNAAEMTLRAEIINQENPDCVTNLYFDHFIRYKIWLSFREYMENMCKVHTATYDRSAANQSWIGWKILRDVEKSQEKNTLEIKPEEFTQKVPNQKPELEPKTNPFELETLKLISKTVQEQKNQPMEAEPTNEP